MLRRKAFTLIELLVVIAIIAILAAILFPVFARAREKGRQSACLSNTKQIGTGFQMYTTDYDERTPGGCYANFGCGFNEQGQPVTPTVNYTALFPLRPYIKNDQVLICPNGTGFGWNRTDARPTRGSYATIRVTAAQGSPLGDFPNPAELVVYADSRIPWLDDLAGYYVHCRLAGSNNGIYCDQYTAGTGCRNCSATGARTDWHTEGFNQVYADGHAKWNKPSQMRYKNYLISVQANPANVKFNCPITIFPDFCNHPGP